MKTSEWGGWGSNPRPADYEKYGLVHRRHYLHGYYEAVPLVALIAPFAPMARSTNRSTISTPSTGRRLRSVTMRGAISAAMRGSPADIDHDGSDPDRGVLRARDLGWSRTLDSIF